jgi:hypothetical protein
MNELFKIGDIIYGYCNGYFGRDDYDSKTCILVSDEFAIFVYTDGVDKGKACVLNETCRLSEELVNEWKTN